MKKVLFILVTLSISVPASAGSFHKKYVSSEAKWALHLDITKFLKTKTGEYVLKQSSEGKAANQLALIQATMHFDPRKDLTSLTFYGTDTNQLNQAAVIDGTFDSKQVLTILRANETHQQFKHGKHIIHSWINKPDASGSAAPAAPPKPVYSCFWDNDTIVFGMGLDSVKSAVDVLDGKAPSLSASPLLSNMTSMDPFTFLTLAADISGMGAIPPQAAMLQGARSVDISLGENMGQVDLAIGLSMTNAEQAQQLQMVVQGMLAAIMLQQNPDPELAKFLRALRVTAAGSKVKAAIKYPVESLIPALEKMSEKSAQRKAGGGTPVPPPPITPAPPVN